MANKSNFIELVQTYIKRDGANRLLEWLTNETDFFTAPASTVYHQSYPGGLCEHSLQVFSALTEEVRTVPSLTVSNETLVLISLFHDVCKTNCYKQDFRNVKNQFGQWERVPYYKYTDCWGMGHGECSVWLLNKFIRLTDEEATAISSHMGGFDCRVKGGSNCISTAFEKYPLAVLLHIADLKSTYLSKNS